MAEVNNFYDEVTTGETDSTNAWSDTTCTVSGLAATTKYLIIAKALIGGEDAGDDFGVRVETADDTGVESKSEARVQPTFTASDELEPYLFVHSFTTDSSPDNVTIQTRSWDTTVLNVDQMSLLLLDLDDLGSSNFFETIDADTNDELNVGFQQEVVIAGSDLGTTEEWLCLGYLRVSMGSTGRSFGVQLNTANDDDSSANRSRHFAEGEDTAELRVVGHAARHKAATADKDAAITASEEHDAANMNRRGGYLIALKGSAFADFKFAYNSGNIEVSTTETTLATITDYTPSSATNHLIIGRTNLNATGGNSRIATYVENSTPTNLMAGDDVAFQTQNWDDTDEEMAVSVLRESLPASQDTFDLQGILDGSETSRNFEHRWLLMLNLELSGAAPADPAPIAQIHQIPNTVGVSPSKDFVVRL